MKSLELNFISKINMTTNPFNSNIYEKTKSARHLLEFILIQSKDVYEVIRESF